MSRRAQNWVILFGIAALVLIADRVTKTIVGDNLTYSQIWEPPVISRLFRFTYTTNTGAAFGLFPDHRGIFVIVAFVVIGAIIFYYNHLPEGYRLARVALGLQLGGALGNLMDRLHPGYVVDFMGFNFWPLRDFPVWNVSDAAIVVGVGLLAVSMLLEDSGGKNDPIGSSESDAASEPGTTS